MYTLEKPHVIPTTSYVFLNSTPLVGSCSWKYVHNMLVVGILILILLQHHIEDSTSVNSENAKKIEQGFNLQLRQLEHKLSSTGFMTILIIFKRSVHY